MMNRHNRQVLFATALIVDHLIVIVDLGVVQLRKTMGQLNQCFIIRIRNNSMLNACDNIRTKLGLINKDVNLRSYLLTFK